MEKRVQIMNKTRIPKVAVTTSMLTHDRVALATKFSVIAIATIAFYFQDLSVIFNNALAEESTFHILAVPFLFLYMLYRKRKMVMATAQQSEVSSQAFLKHFSTIIGCLLCVAATLTYWFGSYTFTPVEYHMITLPFFAAGIVLMLFNIQVLRQLIIPIAFLAFLIPPPAEVLYGIGSTLSNISAAASNALVNLFGINSVISSNYGSPLLTLVRPDQTQMSFSVDVACSGVYSLIGFVIFAVFIAYITRGSIRYKIVILLMSIPLIITLNILRLTAILAIGYNYGDAIALQVFHTIGATVLMFLGTLMLLAITEKVFKKPKPAPPCSKCSSLAISQKPSEDFCFECGKLQNHPKAKLGKIDAVKITSIFLIIVFLVSVQAPVFALTEGPAQIVIQTPSGEEQGNTQILPQINGYVLSFIYRDTQFEELSGQDESLLYVYKSNANGDSVWIAVEIAQNTISLHRWETCLVGTPIDQGYAPYVTQLELYDLQIQDNPPIIGRYFAFQDHTTNQTQVVLYWFETATFTINGTSQQKHVKISVISYPESPKDLSEAENQLLPFALTINDYWQPIKAWSVIALVISQNGMALTVTASALLIAIIFYRILFDQQKKRSLLIFYNKLPESDQFLLQAVSNTTKLHKSTTSTVAIEYQKLSKFSIPQFELIQKLDEFARIGLIKKALISQNDSPALRWKTTII